MQTSLTMEDCVPAIYFIPKGLNPMRALASVHALRRCYEVIAKIDSPDHTGLLVTTSAPVEEKDLRIHGLKPLEDL